MLGLQYVMVLHSMILKRPNYSLYTVL